jgi:hypothetical protein
MSATLQDDVVILVEKLINSDRDPWLLIIEAADKYLPIIDGLTVRGADGKEVKLTSVDSQIAPRVDQTRKALKRADRIDWALRFYQKALAYEALWYCRNDPNFIAKLIGQPPAPEQPRLEHILQKLSDVDLSPFQEYDPDDPEEEKPAYTGFATIDTINARLGEYIRAATEHSATGMLQPINPELSAQLDKAFEAEKRRAPSELEMEPFTFNDAPYLRREGKWLKRQYKANDIIDTRLTKQSFGEVISAFRRENLYLDKRYRGTIQIEPNPWNKEKGDLRDEEGPVETIVKFPDGWRWLNLHRVCSRIRSDMSGLRRQSDERLQLTGHCCNTALGGGRGHEHDEVLELVEPRGGDRWRHHACFILNAKNGILGEMKGRANHKPSAQLFPYIFELLRTYKPVKGLSGTVIGQYGPNYDVAASGDFQLRDLNREQLAILRQERPEYWRHSHRNQLPPGEAGGIVQPGAEPEEE